MPKDVANMMKDLKISPEEVERMTKAFENPQFKELFFDYVKGMENPENKAKYEAEILEMEKQAGIDAKFIHPNPQESLMTKEHTSRSVSYVNIATNDLVDEAKCERDEKKKGFNWSLPHSMTPPRDEMDQDGNKFKTYDVVFHPNTYRMAESNAKFMEMLRETAIDAIRKSWDILLDKKFEILSDKKYFGALSPTILRQKSEDKKTQFEDPALRKDLEKFIEERRAKSKSKISGTRNPETLHNGIIIPEYEIKHSKNIKMQEYVGSQGQAPNRPDNLIITIKLPKLKVTKNIKLDVQDWSLTLKTENEEPRYQLSIDLPYQIDAGPDGANAKYRKDQKTLEVTLPVVIDKTKDSPLIIPPALLPEIKPNKETKSDKERIENENRERNLVDLIPAHNLTLPDFKASESERWCLFEVNVGPDAFGVECKITATGFCINSKIEQGKGTQIGLAISLKPDGVEISESNKYASDGFFEIKLRKTKPGLLKHYWMGKSILCMEDYRFDALISDRQVEGDRSLKVSNEPAIWGERPLAKAIKKKKT